MLRLPYSMSDILHTSVDLPVSLQGFLSLELGTTLVTDDGLLSGWTARKRRKISEHFKIKNLEHNIQKYIGNFIFFFTFFLHKNTNNNLCNLCEQTA